MGTGGGSEEGTGQGYSARRGVGGEFRAIFLISDTLYHAYSYKSLTRFTG